MWIKKIKKIIKSKKFIQMQIFILTFLKLFGYDKF